MKPYENVNFKTIWWVPAAPPKNSKAHTECNVEVDGVLEQAREKVDLKVRLSENSRMERELEQRISIAATAVEALGEPAFENKELSKEAKLTVYNAVMVP